MRRSHIIILATATVLPSACTYECGTLRSTVASGTVRTASGNTLATAQATLSDFLRPTYMNLGVGLMAPAGSAGAPLKGHVTSAKLVTQTGELLYDIPTSTDQLYVDVVIALNTNVSSRDQYERIRSALLSKGAKIVLDTDVAGLEHIETTLTEANDVAGKTSRCSPTA